METNGISLFDQQQPEPPKKDRKTAFVLGGIAALGVAGALGLGFVMGGRGGDGRRAASRASRSARPRSVQVSPTAGAATQDEQQSGNAGAGTTQDTRRAMPVPPAPAPTTAARPAATNTTEPAPTETPEPPTSTADGDAGRPDIYTHGDADGRTRAHGAPTSTSSTRACCSSTSLRRPSPRSATRPASATCTSTSRPTRTPTCGWCGASMAGCAHVSGMESGQVFEKDIALGAAFVTVKFQLHAKDDSGQRARQRRLRDLRRHLHPAGLRPGTGTRVLRPHHSNGNVERGVQWAPLSLSA